MKVSKHSVIQGIATHLSYFVQGVVVLMWYLCGQFGNCDDKLEETRTGKKERYLIFLGDF